MSIKKKIRRLEHEHQIAILIAGMVIEKMNIDKYEAKAMRIRALRRKYRNALTPTAREQIRTWAVAILIIAAMIGGVVSVLHFAANP